MSVMDRRVPKSEKYANVQGKLDTGMNINKVQVITAREFARRRNEIYFRVSAKQLFELLSEYEAEDSENVHDSSFDGAGGPRIVTYSESAEPEYNRPYLILDCRERAEYNQCRLVQARSFPQALLNRDQMHPEIYKFRNKEERLIIIYCDDERISREVCKTLVDRGTDNIFILQGGLKEFAGLYPEFIEGDVPTSWSPPKSALQRTGLSALRRDMEKDSVRSGLVGGELSSRNLAALNRETGSMNSGRSGSSMLHSPSAYGAHRETARGPGGGGRSREERSETGASSMSTRSVADSVISRSMARKGRL